MLDTRPFNCGALVAVAIISGVCLANPRHADAQQGWSRTAVTIEHPASSFLAPRPVMAADQAGNVVAVWISDATFARSVRAARFSSAGKVWGLLEVVHTTGTLPQPADITALQLGLDVHGDGVAAWLSSGVVQMSRYSAVTRDWGPVVDVSVPGEGAREPTLVVAPDGNAFLIWLRSSGGQDIVQASRFARIPGTWSGPVDLSAAGQHAQDPRLAVGADGQATAVWTRFDVSRWVVQARRHSEITLDWGVTSNLSSTGTASHVALAADANGNATVVWRAEEPGMSTIQASRFDQVSGIWGTAVPVSAPDGDSALPRLAIDGRGNVFATWLRQTSVVQAARYALDTNTWSDPVNLSQTGAEDNNVELVADAAGNAVAVWFQSAAIGLSLEAARFSETSGTWGQTTVIDGQGQGPHRTAVDAAGNVIVVHHQNLRGTRFVAETGRWSAPSEIVPPEGQTVNPGIVFDPFGTLHVIWVLTQDYENPALKATRWAATPVDPRITAVEPAPGALSVHFDPPRTTETAFAPLNYAYSVDNGVTWSVRSPASTASPLVIGGLMDLSTYTVRVLAINGAGSGLPTSAVNAIAGPVPGPPIGLRAAMISGNTVTFSWTPPLNGVAPVTEYLLEGGIDQNQTLASIPTGSVAPVFTLVAPTGAFYMRVVALSGSTRSAPSNEIRIHVNVPAPPSAPESLLGTISGSSLALSWRNTHGGGSATSLWLSVTGSITTVLPMPMGEAFTYIGVPPGTYSLRVVAANDRGTSRPSNAVTLTFPSVCSGVPEVPTNFLAWRSGATIFVAWDSPVAGPAPEQYTVQVAGAYTGTFSTTGRWLSGGATSGAYMLTVAAGNRCGSGAATPPRLVTIP